MKRSPLPRRTPLARRSSKGRQQDRTRALLRLQFMAKHPQCERCGQQSTDCHEIIRRSQAKDAAIRPELFVALCRACHQWATENPSHAHRDGFVLWSWEDDEQSLELARLIRRKRFFG